MSPPDSLTGSQEDQEESCVVPNHHRPHTTSELCRDDPPSVGGATVSQTDKEGINCFNDDRQFVRDRRSSVGDYVDD